jgi:hypothetical protein
MLMNLLSGFNIKVFSTELKKTSTSPKYISLILSVFPVVLIDRFVSGDVVISNLSL